jgi:hypothetical protein
MGYLDIVQIREEAIYILSMYMYTHLIYILSIYTYSSNYKCIRALNDSISSFFWRSERYSSSNCDFSRTEVRTKCVTCQNRVRRPTNTTIIGIPVKSWTSELRLYMYNVYVHVYVCVCVCVCVCIAYLISGKWDLLSWPVKRCKNPTIMWGQKEAYYHGKRELLSVKRCRRLLSCEVMRIWTAFFEANKTYNHGKRDLLSWQKRPTIMVKETYYHGKKRPTIMDIPERSWASEQRLSHGSVPPLCGNGGRSMCGPLLTVLSSEEEQSPCAVPRSSGLRGLWWSGLVFSV